MRRGSLAPNLALAPIVMAAAAVLATAASAHAGTVTAATGTFRLNEKDVQLEPGKTVETKAGDRIETLQGSVTWRSATGDDVTVEAGSAAREEPTSDTGAALFLTKGSVTGTLSEKTQLGVAAGWVGAPKGTRARVHVEASAGREAREALFRAIDGAAWIRYRSFNVSLPAAHSVTLAIDPDAAGTLFFRTGQQNAGEVSVHRLVPGGDIVGDVPKATLGSMTDEKGNKTKICDDINSLKTAKIRITTRFVGKSDNTATIGPGTCALVDNATGAIEVLFTAVNFEILERAISLTTEFATLAQSNFSDTR